MTLLTSFLGSSASAAPRRSSREERPALHPGRLGISFGSGYALSMGNQGLDDLPLSKFESTGTSAVSFSYAFYDDAPRRFGLKLSVHHFAMHMVDRLDDGQPLYGSSGGAPVTFLDSDLGELELYPVTIGLVIYDQRFQEKWSRRVAAHLDAGVGTTFGRFRKGNVVKAFEEVEGQTWKIETHPGIAVDLGAGLDFLLLPNVSVALDARALVMEVGTSWEASSGGATLPLTRYTQFEPNQLQMVLGLRYWR